MSAHRSDHNPPGDAAPPLRNPTFGPTANFISVLELFRAQRDSQIHPQAPPPSPSLEVYQSQDNEPLALGDVLSSQITFVTNQEFEQLRQLVPSQPQGLPPLALLEAARIAIPFLSNDLINSSIEIMDNIAKHNDANTLPVASVPPEIWAALRAAIPSQGSRLSSAVARSPSFSTARTPASGNSSPMDDSPINMPPPPLFLEASTSRDTPLNNEDNPIWVSSGDDTPRVNRQVVNDRMSSFSVDHTPGHHSMTPDHTISPHASNRAVSVRSMIEIQNSQDGFLDALMSSDTLLANAETAVQKSLDELNEGVEGYSHYFLQEPLTLCDDPAIEVAPPHLRRILDIAGAALSMGPRDGQDGDIWRMLRPSDWFRASTFILAAVLRGCVRTPRVARMGNFPLLPLRDSFLYGNDLPELNTQTDALIAMATQILENLQLDNGPLLPQDSIDGIRSTVWRSHEAHIRAIVEQEALQVAHRLSTMGLSDLIDKLERDAPIEEITDTLRDDILEQTRSKYNNAVLAAKSEAYNKAIREAEDAGRAEAAAFMKSYESIQMDRAKEQARLKADSEFTRLLADERSKIAPRVDTEIAAEHAKFVTERRKILVAQLDSLAPDLEKEFILAAANRLGLNLDGSDQPAKKVKLDTRKPRPAPTTPRGRSASIISDKTSRKRAHSPSEVAIHDPIPARETSTTPKAITTVAFTLKQESPAHSFVTPPTPSTIRNAVDIADAPSLTPSLRGISSSIHNKDNQMVTDIENIDYRTLFPPGIPAPPSNPSLPPPMSRTPDFGGDQNLYDGVNVSVTPTPPPHNRPDFSFDAMTRAINSAIQPMWAEIRKLEATIVGGQPRAPPRAGPGYRAEFINHPPAPKVSGAPIAPALTNQGTREHSGIQATIPFPSVSDLQQEDEATGPARTADDEFPALNSSEVQPKETNNRRKRGKAVVLRQWRTVPGAVGPMNDEGAIPVTSYQSKIKPLFASIITQDAVAKQQQVKRTADQIRAIQGRKPAGQQGSRSSPHDGNLTEVTVIRFGGLEDEEEERKFRARNPVHIVQSVQRDLARRAKNPPAVLSGRWSQSAGLTGNFVYTLGGIIPPRDIVALKPILCLPFSGRTELVPTKGWTWIQLRQVPTEDENHCIWGPEDLLTAFRQNPCFQDTLICVQPHWQGNPLTSDKAVSTVLAAIIDDDNSACQAALTHGVRMFGAQVKFLRCGDNPTLQQCGRCHMLGHYSNSPRCKLPKGAVKCYRCGGSHDGRDHDYECNARTHKSVGKCDCALKCLLCKKTGHNARSRACLKRGDFQPPRLPDTDKHVTRTDDFIPVTRQKRGGNRKQTRRTQPTARIDDEVLEDEPFRGHFTVPESQTIPLPMCPTEIGKNVLLCMCCALPSVAEYRKRFVTPLPTTNDDRNVPTARIISSKGQSIMGIYAELRTRKAYGTALLANNTEAANAIRDSVDLHEEEEIQRLLDEAHDA
ncbi:hypothetical protein V8E53_004504 [Lactarius tabidus]